MLGPAVVPLESVRGSPDPLEAQEWAGVLEELAGEEEALSGSLALP